MSSKYVPPAMRNKQRKPENRDKPQPPPEQPKVCELNDTNFPELVKPKNSMSVWGGTKSFAELANEWKSKDESDEILKQSEERRKTQESAYVFRQNIPLPKFHNVRRFIEPEDDQDYNRSNDQQEESDWILVDRKKVHHEKTFEEKIAKREIESVEETNKSTEEQAQEYESCWDN